MDLGDLGFSVSGRTSARWKKIYDTAVKRCKGYDFKEADSAGSHRLTVAGIINRVKIHERSVLGTTPRLRAMKAALEKCNRYYTLPKVWIYCGTDRANSTACYDYGKMPRSGDGGELYVSLNGRGTRLVAAALTGGQATIRLQIGGSRQTVRVKDGVGNPMRTTADVRAEATQGNQDTRLLKLLQCIFWHELGHAAHMKENPGHYWKFSDVITEVGARPERHPSYYVQMRRQGYTEIGQYGGENPLEYVAEVFSLLISGGSMSQDAYETYLSAGGPALNNARTAHGKVSLVGA